MLSEGVDIPELQAALFLSTVTANLKTIQRIGRVLRGEGMALIAMFADPHYVQIASDIMKEKEYYEQIVLAQASTTEYATSERGAGAAKVVIPTGISSWPSLVVNNGFSHDFELFERVRGRLESRGLPSSFDRVANVIEMADHGLLSLEAFLQ
jgi:superfamily II DNA or RNA helicase